MCNFAIFRLRFSRAFTRFRAGFFRCDRHTDFRTYSFAFFIAHPVDFSYRGIRTVAFPIA